MEQLHTSAQKELSGGRVLRLLTFSPDEISSGGEHLQSKQVSADDLRERFVTGNGLANGEILLVNGEDIMSRLPRPEQFGNRCLALIDLLDSVPKDTVFALEDDESAPLAAAD